MHLALRREPYPALKALNSKTKLLYFLSLLILTLATKSSYFLSLILFSHLLLCYATGLTIKKILKSLAEPLFVALMLILVKSVSLSPLSFNIQALFEGLIIALRILSAFSLFLFFYHGIFFTEILALLNWLRLPLLLQELIFLSFRFTSILHQEIATIYLSQKNRLGYTTFSRSLRSLRLLVQGSFFQSFRHTEKILQAMEQRGFDYKNLIPYLSPIPHKDLMLLIITISTWLVLWILL
ncbi:MAG: hypothetical protein N2Z40_04730 [Caldimicrobium sp.]|nr:hypothetical protein [Caldimicrobium sp.]MCX7613507.1 hypothetical protein [Caldimicrobium sp.]MDW8182569.1 CbiQ family ECF transporter T component [Caldimicrobium sp.]